MRRVKMSDFRVGEEVWLLPGARSEDAKDGYVPKYAQVDEPTLVTVIGAFSDDDKDLSVSNRKGIFGYVLPEYLSREKPKGWVTISNNPETYEAASTSVLEVTEDNVNHPSHYNFSNGAEVIDIAEQLSFNGGNAVKYVARAPRQDGKVKGNVLDDFQNAAFCIQREIERTKWLPQ